MPSTKELEERLEHAREFLGTEQLGEELSRFDAEMSDASFWSRGDAQEVVQKAGSIRKILSRVEQARTAIEEALTAWELSEEDPAFADEAALLEDTASQLLASLEDEALFSGEFDEGSATITIHPGEGGLEAQDFARMLFDMYAAYAKRKGWKAEVIDYVPDELKGVQNAVLSIAGKRVYGMLAGDNGVHRLVRVSPTDEKGRRHTSFASVEVMPVLPDDIEVDLDERDIDLDVFRSSGPGGQGVNTTDSAVRLTHRPTGIVVSCQVERSQLRNRERAMAMLKAKLYELALEEKKRQSDELAGEKATSAWGHQIRSYVLYPFQQVQDLRSREKFPNAEGILAGDLDELVLAYRRWAAGQGKLR